eukprot:CAMPEP_0174699412 /NCGR_PEP_ID=MMETSP1094-20130205/4697_1 /TAXON_ID=156173 /ORGANISM="Chrysochromulina brevifilum, Strain UTEX LB 985" /LENGTH=53 /DNA_ID=CAMNT_0015896737 /DNA_START=726 /DNA_END=887 /DNA_ORIENTATION=-
MPTARMIRVRAASCAPRMAAESEAAAITSAGGPAVARSISYALSLQTKIVPPA